MLSLEGKERVTQLDKKLPVGWGYVRLYIQVLDARVQSRQVTMLGQSEQHPTGYGYLYDTVINHGSIYTSSRV